LANYYPAASCYPATHLVFISVKVFMIVLKLKVAYLFNLFIIALKSEVGVIPYLANKTTNSSYELDIKQKPTSGLIYLPKSSIIFYN